jgi:hypothetical protein
MKILLITACFLFPALCEAQDAKSIDDQIKVRITQLKTQKVDTVVCYYTKCAGEDENDDPDTCFRSQRKYLIWKVRAQAYLQRFDPCGSYPQQKVVSDLPVTVAAKIKKIRSARILTFRVLDTVGFNQKTYGAVINYTCHTFFEFYTPSKKFTKDIDSFLLDTEYVDGRRSIYYRENQQSILATLKKQAEQVVEKYD